MRQALFLVALVATATATAAACGGRATLGSYDENTPPGEGGSSTSSSGGGTTTTGTTSTTSWTTSTTTWTTSTTTWTTSTTTWTTSTTTTEPPPPICDFSGSCDTCVQCAFEGPCSAVWDACFASPACMDFLDCVNNCSGPPGPCFQTCSQGNPQGAQQYLVAAQCILCDACASDCAGQGGPICDQP